MIALTALLLVLSEFQIGAKEVGVFRPSSIHKHEDGYVISSRSEGILAIFDEHGKRIARYAKAGSGPLELDQHAYLGFHNGFHVVVNGNARIIAFDMGLNPQKDKYRKLPGELSQNVFLYGLVSSNKWLWVQSGISLQSHLVHTASYAGRWNTQKSFPQKFTESDIRKKSDYLRLSRKNYRLDVHNTTGFLSGLSVPMDEDYYSVEVYSDITKNEITMVLEADVRDQPQATPRMPVRGFVKNGFVFSDGFAVQWKGKDKKTDKALTTYIDFFKPDGAFRLRRQIESPLYPCINAPEAFLFKERKGTEHFIRVSSIASILTHLIDES